MRWVYKKLLSPNVNQKYEKKNLGSLSQSHEAKANFIYLTSQFWMILFFCFYSGLKICFVWPLIFWVW